jgi:hypothetical protein
MRNIRRIGSAALLFVTLTCPLWSKQYPAAKPVVAAYVFTQGQVLTPGGIDAKKLTRVNYAFANIAEGRIVEGAPAALLDLRCAREDCLGQVRRTGWREYTVDLFAS